MNEDELLTQSREKETARRYAMLAAKQRYRDMGVPECHNKIITPYTHPLKFTRDEKAFYDAGKCSWVVEYGTINGIVHCGLISAPGATVGYCTEHEADLLEEFYPDGSRK